MSLQRTIGIVSLCVGFLCLVLAIDSFRRVFGIVKWGLDADFAVVDSSFIRHDLSESERTEYDQRKAAILGKYALLHRNEMVAGSSIDILLTLAAYELIIGCVLLRRSSKIAEPRSPRD